VNPVHAGGKILPYRDTAPPVVGALIVRSPPTRPWRPTLSLAQPDTSHAIRPNHLHGLVELRAQIGDPQSYLGFLARNPTWPTQFHPYRVSVEIRAEPTGQIVLRRVKLPPAVLGHAKRARRPLLRPVAVVRSEERNLRHNGLRCAFGA
jgi:hypothetical protein